MKNLQVVFGLIASLVALSGCAGGRFRSCEETNDCAGAAGQGGEDSSSEAGGKAATTTAIMATGGAVTTTSTGGSSSSTTSPAGGTTSTTTSTAPACDPLKAENCDCGNGVIGAQWWQGDCKAKNACICPPSTNTGTGGATSTTIASVAGASSVTVTGGQSSVATGGAGTGGATTTSTTPTGSTVVLRFYALDSVTWPNFVLAVTGLMQKDYSCTGDAIFRECTIPNVSLASSRQFYASTGLTGAGSWLPGKDGVSGQAQAYAKAVYVYRLNGNVLEPMSFRFISNPEGTGFNFEWFANGVRPGNADDDRSGLASPNDCNDGNPTIDSGSLCSASTLPITGGGGPDLLTGTGGASSVTGGGGPDLVGTGGTTGTSTSSTVRNVQIDFIHTDTNVTLNGDSARAEMIAPTYKNTTCSSMNVPDPAWSGQMIKGWRCHFPLVDLTKETIMQGYVGSLYLARYVCTTTGCGTNERVASSDFRAYAYYADGSSMIPLASLDQGRANWSRTMWLRFTDDRSTVHAVIPASL